MEKSSPSAAERYKLIETKEIFLKTVTFICLGYIQQWDENNLIIVDGQTSLTAVI